MLERDQLTITTQYLNQNPTFANGTPSNYIIFKKKPGLGATYGEIECKDRNSIILEPNTPVLEGKRDAVNENGEKLHPNILIVYKPTDKSQVTEYLNSDIKPKKIICTPEAYISKVKPEIEDSQFNLYKDFFMLLDECDRIIKDVVYRKKITVPMADFFKFESRSMVSATAIEPSDVRFAQNNFRILSLIPSVDTRQDLDLMQTNNVLYAVRDTIKKNVKKNIFVFVNSPNLAHILIKRLKIESVSKIFCSSSGVRSLKRDKFDNASSKLIGFTKINFLTSRYYSAVDIILDEKPCVIMISDVLRRTFTMLDPYTDVIQIIGRFRNGVSNATHITNFSDQMEWKTPEEAIDFINDGYNCYQKIKVITDANTTTDGGKITGKQALEGTEIHSFVDVETGELNSFMIDNYSLEQKTIHNYTDIKELKDAYNDTEYFKIKFSPEWYDVSDSLMLILEKKSRDNESNKIIANILQNYKINRVIAFLTNPHKTISTEGDTIQTITKEYPEIVDIFDTIDFERMEALDFDLRKMSRESKKTKRRNETNNIEMIKEIHMLYLAGDKPTRNKVRTDLQTIYTKYQIVKRAAATDITDYFDAELINTNPRHWNITGIKTTE